MDLQYARLNSVFYKNDERAYIDFNGAEKSTISKKYESMTLKAKAKNNIKKGLYLLQKDGVQNQILHNPPSENVFEIIDMFLASSLE